MRKLWTLGFIVVLMLGAVSGLVMAQDDAAAEETGAWLGIAVIEGDTGVTIARVQTGSPADAADLLIGDVIVSVDGSAIGSAAILSETVQTATAGDTITLEVLRNDQTMNIDATLINVPVRGRRAAPEIDPVAHAERLLHADLEAGDAGYTVIDTFSLRNPFELVEGDVVVSVNDIAIADLDMQALHETMIDMEEPMLTVVVTRDGAEVTLTSDAIGGRGFGPGGRGGPDFGPGGRGGPDFGHGGRGGPDGGRGGFFNNVPAPSIVGESL